LAPQVCPACLVRGSLHILFRRQSLATLSSCGIFAVGKSRRGLPGLSRWKCGSDGEKKGGPSGCWPPFSGRSAEQVVIPGTFASLPGTPDTSRLGQPMVQWCAYSGIETDGLDLWISRRTDGACRQGRNGHRVQLLNPAAAKDVCGGCYNDSDGRRCGALPPRHPC
jgi:hypothetical protein